MHIVKLALLFLFLCHVKGIEEDHQKELVAKLEKSFLSLFGLKEKPKVDASKIKIPHFMMRLYKKKSLQESLHQKREEETDEDLPKEDLESLQELEDIEAYGNTIRSYYPSGLSFTFNREIS